MELRLRWFVSNIQPSLLKTLGEKMTADEFNLDRDFGFQIRHRRRDFLEGKYIEKTESLEVIEDPFGGTQELRRTEFKQTDFRIYTSSPAIEIQNPLRSCKGLIDKIWDYANGDIYIEPARARVSDWLAAIEAEVGSVTVVSARVSDLSLTNSTFAKIELSGTSDVRNQIHLFPGIRPASFDRAEFLYANTAEGFRCELASEGRAMILSGAPTKATSLLRTSLAQALASKASLQPLPARR